MSDTSMHVLWDWNGTLLDDAWLCVDVVNRLRAARRMPLLDADEYARVFCFPVSQYYVDTGFDLERESFEALAGEFMAEYETDWRRCPPRAGAREVLDFCRSAGVRQSVLSAAHTDLVRRGLAHFGIESYFDEVAGRSDHSAAGKVDVGRSLLATLDGNGAGNLVLIGDTTHDAEIARDLGVACWLVPSGHMHPDRLRSTGALVLPDLAAVRQELARALECP